MYTGLCAVMTLLRSKICGAQTTGYRNLVLHGKHTGPLETTREVQRARPTVPTSRAKGLWKPEQPQKRIPDSEEKRKRKPNNYTEFKRAFKGFFPNTSLEKQVISLLGVGG